MIEELIKVWKSFETKQLAKIFKQYMDDIQAKKFDWKRKEKDNTHSYILDGKNTNWNRVQCHYYKDSAKYPDENLLIVLRKRAGDYLIVSKNGVRAFEVDYSGIRHYEENLLKEIIGEHKPLFDLIFAV